LRSFFLEPTSPDAGGAPHPSQRGTQAMNDLFERMQTWIAALLLSGIVAAFYVVLSAIADPSFSL
jgi:hypothetical protein